MDESPSPAELDIAIRAFGTRSRPDRTGGQWSGRHVRRADPSEALIFDTETATGPSQRLQIGVWRLYSDRAGAEAAATCVEEGFFYANDLPGLDPDGFARLKAYVRTRGDADVAPGFPSRLRLMSASNWLEKRLFRYGYRHRAWAHSDVVGFNLTFDLGRLASHASEAGGDRGAFSLGLWGSYDDAGRWHDTRYHPRLIVRSIDPRRTLYSWGSLKKEDTTGASGPARLVDLHTLVFALTDQNHSLETAGAAFGDHWEKDPIPYGVIDARALDYARDDVRHTSILYRACLAELRLHTGIDLDAPRLYSPATVGTRYLEAIGVAHPLDRFMADPELVRDLPGVTVGQRIHPRLVGYAMGGFFGGRAEARLVRIPMPVTLVDGTSLYPTVNANLRTWELLTADRIDVVDVTGDVEAFLSAPGLEERVLEREAWSEAIGVTLVEVVDPEGDILPVRAFYDPKGLDPGIGVNPLTYAGKLWYLLPDVIAAALLTGRPPRIARALRLVGVGRQSKLRPVALRGGRMIDPYADDPFVRIVEERHRIDRDLSRSKDERERLSRFLKITANATAFGILARFDRRELSAAVPVTVWGPDATPRTKDHHHPEDPGPYTFPPIAATITAAARLMLALLERLVTDAGGTYVFCDTDSMAIVARPASGDPIQCPTPDRTDKVTGLDRPTIERILARFEGLNPYEPDLAIPVWKIEHDSLDRPVTCYSISAKRYLLYRPLVGGPAAELLHVGDEPESAEGDAEVRDELTDWSEHGLGLYLSPLVDERGRAIRDEKRRRVWVRDGWRWVLDDALGAKPARPPWADLPAVTRFTISGPAIASWFRGRDADLPPAERMHPGGFGLLAHPAEEDAAGRMPAGPYETNPERWIGQNWYDRRSHRQVRITTEDPVRSPERFAAHLAAGALRVRALGEILATYDQRPEHKSLSPDGSPTGARTVGLLRRRPVRSSPARTHLSGKEGNKLIERLAGVTAGPDDYRTDFGMRSDPWVELVVPVLGLMGASEVVHRTHPAWRRSIERIIKDEIRPKQREREKALTVAAVAYARERLGDSASAADRGVLSSFLETKGASFRLCACGCGRPVRSARAKWFDEACRKRAARRLTQEN